MLICVNNQTIEWPPKTSNREKLVTLIAITEATGGLSYPIRNGTLTRALRFYPNQFHTSAMKNVYRYLIHTMVTCTRDERRLNWDLELTNNRLIMLEVTEYHVRPGRIRPVFQEGVLSPKLYMDVHAGPRKFDLLFYFSNNYLSICERKTPNFSQIGCFSPQFAQNTSSNVHHVNERPPLMCGGVCVCGWGVCGVCVFHFVLKGHFSS